MNTLLNGGAQATVYTKLGQTLRVPLRQGRAPERQFMRWFNRQSAANPGFPARVRSLLFITPAPLCPACRQHLLRFLQRHGLAGRVRLSSPGATACACGCTAPRLAPAFAGWFDSGLLGEDEPKQPAAGIPEGQLGNGLYPSGQAARQAAQQEAARLKASDPQGHYSVVHHADRFSRHYHVARNGQPISGHFMYGRPLHRVLAKDLPPGTRRGTTTESQQRIFVERGQKSTSRRQRRRLAKGTLELAPEWELALDAAQPEGPFAGAGAGELEFELTKEQDKALRKLVADKADELRQRHYALLDKSGRSGGAVRPQVDDSVHTELLYMANRVRQQPALLQAAAAIGASQQDLVAALKSKAKQLLLNRKNHKSQRPRRELADW